MNKQVTRPDDEDAVYQLRISAKQLALLQVCLELFHDRVVSKHRNVPDEIKDFDAQMRTYVSNFLDLLSADVLQDGRGGINDISRVIEDAPPGARVENRRTISTKQVIEEVLNALR